MKRSTKATVQCQHAMYWQLIQDNRFSVPSSCFHPPTFVYGMLLFLAGERACKWPCWYCRNLRTLLVKDSGLIHSRRTPCIRGLKAVTAGIRANGSSTDSSLHTGGLHLLRCLPGTHQTLFNTSRKAKK
jgi:hypothetical protein